MLGGLFRYNPQTKAPITPVAWEDGNGNQWITAPGQSLVYKSADQSVVNSAVLQDDDELRFPVNALTNYWFRMLLLFHTSGSAAPDFKFALRAIGGSALLRACMSYVSRAEDYTPPEGVVGGTGFVDLATAVELVFTTSPGATSPGFVAIEGSIGKDATPGSLGLQWAQRVSSASPVVVLAGSILRYQEIP